MKNLAKLPLYLMLLLFLALSCDPEDSAKNPADYELYISISADKYPAISLDGSLIAYYHKCLESPEPTTYPTGLYIMDANGLNRRLLLKGDHWSPSWSPDGQWLAFISNGTLQIVNLEGDSVRTFQGINNVPLSFPDWSKDGKTILFNSSLVNGGGVFVCDPLFLNVMQLFNQFQISGFSAQWTPNSNKIIYEKVSHDWVGGEIYIIDTLGLNDIRITHDDVDDREPTLSPNGDLIACSKNVRIHVMNSDGTGQQKLDYGQHPTWAPNSKYIIYCNANSDLTKEVLWKIEVDGKNKTQLTF